MDSQAFLHNGRTEILTMALPRRYKYNLSHNVATYGQLTELIPFMRMEIAPGDTISGKIGLLTRLSPLKNAVLTNMTVDTFLFYVPHRLVWDQWEDFIAEGPNPENPRTPPQVNGVLGTSYMFMAHNSPEESVNALPFRAYNLVYNEFFRDEEQSTVLPDTIQVQQAPVKRSYHSLIRKEMERGEPQMIDVLSDQVSAEEILRKVAAQKLQMRRETYGSRYIDVLRSYGVRVSYQMLQRPEVIHASKRQISVSDVVATSESQNTELGSLAGHGISGQTINIRRRQFPEHGTLLGIHCIRPDPMSWLINGHFDLPRDFSSYYDPGLTTLPPVELTRADLFCNQTNRPEVLGHHPWGEWYRREPNRMRPGLGTFVTDVYSEGTAEPPNLMTWEDAVKGVPPANYDAIFTNVDNQHFQTTATNRISARRLIPRNQNSYLSKGI